MIFVIMIVGVFFLGRIMYEAFQKRKQLSPRSIGLIVLGFVLIVWPFVFDIFLSSCSQSEVTMIPLISFVLGVLILRDALAPTIFSGTAGIILFLIAVSISYFVVNFAACFSWF